MSKLFAAIGGLIIAAALALTTMPAKAGWPCTWNGQVYSDGAQNPIGQFCRNGQWQTF